MPSSASPERESSSSLATLHRDRALTDTDRCSAFTTGAQNPDYFFGGRFLIGWAVGGLSAAVPLYNSEISPPELRGTVVSIQQFAIVSGICVSFWL